MRFARAFILAALLVLVPLTSTPQTSRQDGLGLTLREYVDVRFEAQEKAVSAALAAAKEAVAKAETASDKRFDAVNEFRSSLNDITRTLMPRAEAETQFKTINEKLDALTVRENARDSRGAGISSSWAYLVGAVGVLVALYSLLRSRRTGAR